MFQNILKKEKLENFLFSAHFFYFVLNKVSNIRHLYGFWSLLERGGSALYMSFSRNNPKFLDCNKV